MVKKDDIEDGCMCLPGVFSEAPKTPPRKPDSSCATESSTGDEEGESFRVSKRVDTYSIQTTPIIKSNTLLFRWMVST